jgi:prevent-host-death family protein
MKPQRLTKNQISAFDAKTRFGDLLARVTHGEEIVITRHGHPVARLVPFTAQVDRVRARGAAERLANFGVADSPRLPAGVSVADLINEGRE